MGPTDHSWEFDEYAEPPPPVRAPIEGRYALQERLGRGGMGEVYRARDLQGARDVAVKLTQGLRPNQLERFRREGEATARLRHPHVVRVHASGAVQGRGYLVYELIERARPLDDAFQGAGLEQRVRWVRDAARGLGQGHEEGITHRDVKPENLLVGADGKVRVTDYGLATYEGLEKLTQTGAMIGTPLFMSPEQITGGAVGPPGDVWSLGVVLYLALHDELPFLGSNVFELAGRIASDDPERLALESALARQIDIVCRRALCKAPKDRYPDGGALADALDLALRGQLRPGRRLPAWAWLVPLLALAVLGVVFSESVEDEGVGLQESTEPLLPKDTPAERFAPPTTDEDATPPSDRPVRRFRHGPEGFLKCAFLGSDRVISVGPDLQVKVWDRRSGALLARHEVDDRPAENEDGDWDLKVLCALGGLVVTGGPSRGIFRLHVDDGRIERVDYPAQVLIPSRDRKSYFVGGRHQQVVRFDAVSGKALAAYGGHHPQIVQGLALLGEDRLATFTGSSAFDSSAINTLRVFDLAQGESPLYAANIDAPVKSLTVSQSGRLFAGTTIGQLFELDARSGAIVGEFLPSAGQGGSSMGGFMKGRAHGGAVRVVILSADEQTLHVASRTPQAELVRWDVASRTPRGERLVVPGQGYEQGELSDDGNWLLMASRDGIVDLWWVGR